MGHDEGVTDWLPPGAGDNGPRSRQARFGKNLRTFVLAVLVFLLGATVIVEPVRTWAVWRVMHLGSEPTCQDPGWLEPVAMVNAHATSYLPTDEGVTYFPGNSADGDMSTAWAAIQTLEGPPLSLSWTLAKPDVVRLVCITPGYAKSADRFKNNQRLKKFSLDLDGDRQLVSVPPIEPASYQTLVSIATSCVNCQRIEMTVLETYTAENGDSEVAISEVTSYRDPRIWILAYLPW